MTQRGGGTTGEGMTWALGLVDCDILGSPVFFGVGSAATEVFFFSEVLPDVSSEIWRSISEMSSLRDSCGKRMPISSTERTA